MKYLMITLTMFFCTTVRAESNFRGADQFTLEHAENLRKYISRFWIGKNLPRWNKPCPIAIMGSQGDTIGGQTTFSFNDGEVFNWSMLIYANNREQVGIVLSHEIQHTIAATLARRKIVRWMDEGCAEIFVTRQQHETARKRAWELKDYRLNPWYDIDRMEYINDSQAAIYIIGFSMSEYLLDTKGKKAVLAFQKDNRPPSQKFKDYFGVTVSEGKKEWEKWFIQNYRRHSSYKCKYFGCQVPVHRPGWSLDTDPFVEGNSKIKKDTPSVAMEVNNPSCDKSPYTFPSYPPPPECRKPYIRPYVRPYDLDSDKEMSFAIDKLRKEMGGIKVMFAELEKKVKESTIEYEQPENSSVSIIINNLKSKIQIADKKLSELEGLIEKVQEEIKVIKEKIPEKNSKTDFSSLIKQLEVISKRIEALEEVKIPVQILKEDGTVLDEDIYDLGETIKLKIIPKRRERR